MGRVHWPYRLPYRFRVVTRIVITRCLQELSGTICGGTARVIGPRVIGPRVIGVCVIGIGVIGVGIVGVGVIDEVIDVRIGSTGSARLDLDRVLSGSAASRNANWLAISSVQIFGAELDSASAVARTLGFEDQVPLSAVVVETGSSRLESRVGHNRATGRLGYP